MQPAKSTVSRIEFRTKMTRADAEVITLGYMVESLWEDSRWMGMVFRPELTANEVREVNVETWPEMANPGEFLKNIFDWGWLADDGEAAAVLAAKYGPMSALHVYVEDNASPFADGLGSAADDGVADELRERLVQRFAGSLKPSHSAKILGFAFGPKPSFRHGVNPVRKAAGEPLRKIA